jgi:hypothetical protein
MVVACVGLVGFAHSVAAQGIGQGFVYGGPIAPLSTAVKPAAALTFGGGLEALTRSGAGASLEAGVFGLDGLWIPQLSANAIYEKRPRASGVSPFITGGLTLSGQAINFGGGAKHLDRRPRRASDRSPRLRAACDARPSDDRISCGHDVPLRERSDSVVTPWL